ncbi:Lsr2 family protein [Nocardia sp. NBC_00511]|uniref:histone-like nucleoid-structuring protein Lsr2 n=1 Tax=Nocardia sp. NBC_00511 TaxID=2903591 RepID=UPI0030E36010
MARKVIVEMVDDFDGESIAEETVLFAVDGVDYEIDLSALNAAALRGQFERWTAHASKVGRTTKGKAAAAKGAPAVDREQSRAIRDWARANGFDVSARGRVAVEVIEAYNKADAA